MNLAKRAIITGSTGLIGSAVSKHLALQGYELICLGRKKLSKTEINSYLGENVTYLSLPMSEIASLPDRTEIKGWNGNGTALFYNFAWSGEKKLTDGKFSEQLDNAVNAAEAVRVAKKLGCAKFINSGSLEETFIEIFLNDREPNYYSDQTNYGLAKLASRDMCKVVAYLERIDYVHTRISVPLSSNLAQGTYIAATLKNIIEGRPYQAPKSNQLYDLILIEDVVKAYQAVGEKGKNKSDYFIGTGLPVTLQQYFEWFSRAVIDPNIDEIAFFEGKQKRLFSPDPLNLDTGFIAGCRIKNIIPKANLS